MTEQQAREQGLHFTGIYNSNKEETKTRIAEYKKLYPKARIVLVRKPVDKLSRGYFAGACGWAAYADNVFQAYETITHHSRTIENFQKTYDYYKKEFDEKISKLTTDFENAKQAITNANETINNANKKVTQEA